MKLYRKFWLMKGGKWLNYSQHVKKGNKDTNKENLAIYLILLNLEYDMDIVMQSSCQFGNGNLGLTFWNLIWFNTQLFLDACNDFIILRPKNIFTQGVRNYSDPYIKEKTSFDVPHIIFNFVDVQILLFVALTVPHQGIDPRLLWYQTSDAPFLHWRLLPKCHIM